VSSVEVNQPLLTRTRRGYLPTRKVRKEQISALNELGGFMLRLISQSS
jgi:hypothetical protein